MTKSVESQIRSLKLEAVSYKKLENYSKAERCILKALDLKPGDNSLNHELAKIFFKNEKYHDCLELLLVL